MDESSYGPIREVLASAAADAELRRRLVADPLRAIVEETGIELPADWNLVARVEAGGAVSLAFTGEEIPDFLLDSITGGAPISFSFPPLVINFRQPY
jgi:hypothetical protein